MRNSTEPPAPKPTIRAATAADLPRIIELLAQLSMDDDGEPREELRPPLPERYREVFQEIEADLRQRLLVLEARGRVRRDDHAPRH